MLVIRDSQRGALARGALARWRPDVEAHLERFFPERFPAPHERARFIEGVLARACEHGLSSPREFCLLATLWASQRHGFDAPEARWIDETLADESLGLPGERLSRAMTRALYASEGEDARA